MKFSTGFFPVLVASALQLAGASPAVSTHDLSARAPVPATKLTCDGDTYKCTANLNFGDGRWVAQWPTSVFHTGSLARPSGHELALMAPVPVKKLTCDGDSYKCTATLDYGDGRWVAQWSTAVFHTNLFGNSSPNEVGTLAPVPVNKLACDGDSYKCTANLDFGDGRWVAQWSTAVFHTSTLEGGSLFSQ